MSGKADIEPVPTSEEAAVIAAVLRVLRRAKPAPSGPSMPAWQRAARREALHTELPHEPGGWGRAE